MDGHQDADKPIAKSMTGEVTQRPVYKTSNVEACYAVLASLHQMKGEACIKDTSAGRSYLYINLVGDQCAALSSSKTRRAARDFAQPRL